MGREVSGALGGLRKDQCGHQRCVRSEHPSGRGSESGRWAGSLLEAWRPLWRGNRGQSQGLPGAESLRHRESEVGRLQ